MPKYVIAIDTDVILTRERLDVLEDVVYDTLVDKFGGAPTVDADGAGLTDVEAKFD